MKRTDGSGEVAISVQIKNYYSTMLQYRATGGTLTRTAESALRVQSVVNWLGIAFSVSVWGTSRSGLVGS